MSAPGWAAKTLRWCAPPLALLTLWAAWPMFLRAWGALFYPYQLDPIESKLLQQALWLRAGHPIYFPITETPPWVVGNYPPLFPWLMSLGADPAMPDFFWPRLLTLFSTLAIGTAAVLFVWTITRSVVLGVFAAGLWWATYEVFCWAPFARVDLPALAFGTWGFALAAHWIDRWSIRRSIIVCTLFWLAWLTRQSQVLLPLAVVIARYFSADRGSRVTNHGVPFALTWLAGVALLFAALCLFTRGAFWTLSVHYNVNTFRFEQTLIWCRHLLRFWPAGLAALGLCLLALEFQRLRGERERLPWILLLVLVALCLESANIFATGKSGAALNYLLEPLWCLSIGLPVLWWWLSQSRSLAPFFALTTLLITLQVAWHVVVPHIPKESWLQGPFPNRTVWRIPITREDLLRDITLENEARDARGPILSEYGIYALRAGKQIVHEPFLMTELAREGIWNEGPLLDAVRRGDYALIITGDNLASVQPWYQSATPAFAQAVRESYRLEKTWPGVITLHVWHPAH